jgi:bacterioferritin-associated ferredoxin
MSNSSAPKIMSNVEPSGTPVPDTVGDSAVGTIVGTMAPRRQEFQAAISGRDELHLTVELDGETIRSARLSAIGCPELLALVEAWRPRLGGDRRHLALPEGNGHADMLMRELILKVRGEWKFPYGEQELCHCRAIPTAKVDAAIIDGAHRIETISRRTSAGTSCGACKPDIEAILNYRLRASARGVGGGGGNTKI